MHSETTAETLLTTSACQTSEESEAARNSALEFLEAMESRHDYVLEELDRLNERIELVLEEYSQGRKESGVRSQESGVRS